MALKASRAWSQEPTALREKEISLQEVAHNVQHVTKAATPQKTGPDLPAGLRGSPGQVASSCGSLGSYKLAADAAGTYVNSS